MKNMGKKHGTTFLEIVLALSIIGIISLSVFSNIFLSIKQNQIVDSKQKNSIIGQMVYEEIKNLSNDEFEKMIVTLKSKHENPLEANVYPFLKDEFLEIAVDSEKKRFGDNTHYFKVYQKRDSDIYVKISFEGLNFDEDSMGLDTHYDINSNVINYQEWKQESDCDLIFTIDKENENKNEIDYYKVTIKRKNEDTETVYSRLEANQVKGRVVYENNTLTIQNIGKNSLDPVSHTENAHVYINNNTNQKFNFILQNNMKNDFLKVYLNQKKVEEAIQDESEDETENKTEGEAENEIGKIQFSSYGEKVQIFSNDINQNPFGEHIQTRGLCKYTVCIYNKKDEKINPMSEIVGYKKFKRFEK